MSGRMMRCPDAPRAHTGRMADDALAGISTMRPRGSTPSVRDARAARPSMRSSQVSSGDATNASARTADPSALTIGARQCSTARSHTDASTLAPFGT